MATKEPLKLFRTKLGLSQRQLAGLLRIPRQTVSMIESNARTTDTQTWIRLLEIDAMYTHVLSMNELTGSVEKQESRAKKEKEKLAGKLRRNMNQSRERIQLLEKQLEKARGKNEQVANWLRLLDKLWDDLPEDARESLFGKWIIMQQDTAVKHLAKYSPAQQKLLQLKIDVLNYECDVTLKMYDASFL